MKKWLRRVIAVLILGGGALAAVAAWLWHDLQTNLDQPIVLHGNSELFTIERGSSLAGLASRLTRAGWIKHAYYLRFEARRLGIGGRIQAGLYEISDGATPRELLQKFVAGDVKTFTITFIEGATFREMLAVLARHPYLEQSLQELGTAGILARVAPGLDHPEGWFFPSTYRFSSGQSDADILRRAHAQLVEILDRYWIERRPDLPYAEPVDALIMASIIEKETGRADERALIAGVFVRRLEKGMKLQTDPTVIYGLGDAFDGNLRRTDLETDTPYNTYTRPGLPPTPIAMPGEAAIRAALNPAAGDALYFVGKGDGSHVFSRTLAEHNAAVRRYQLPGGRRDQ
tara:strand:- start:687 stop:1718 length:1032 start_codon:yes stop_codon:yes gene_type:complete